MKAAELALMLIVVGAATILLTTFFFIQAGLSGDVVAVEEVDYHFLVDSSPGFDLGTDAIRLGAVSPGGHNSRKVNVEAGTDRVRAVVIGSGSNILYPEEADVPLVNGSAVFNFIATPPMDAKKGEYKGEVRFIFYDVND